MTDPQEPQEEHLSDDALDQVTGGEERFDPDDKGRWGNTPLWP